MFIPANAIIGPVLSFAAAASIAFACAPTSLAAAIVGSVNIAASVNLSWNLSYLALSSSGIVIGFIAISTILIPLNSTHFCINFWLITSFNSS